MKYSPLNYAKALREVLATTPDNKHEEVVKNFAQVIHKNGDGPHLDRIMGEVEKLLTRDKGGKMVVLEFARPMPEALVAAVKKNFTPHDDIRLEVNPALVAGTRITIDGERELDLTLVRRLGEMFKC